MTEDIYELVELKPESDKRLTEAEGLLRQVVDNCGFNSLPQGLHVEITKFLNNVNKEK